jgi:hypothetical protein
MVSTSPRIAGPPRPSSEGHRRTPVLVRTEKQTCFSLLPASRSGGGSQGRAQHAASAVASLDGRPERRLRAKRVREAHSASILCSQQVAAPATSGCSPVTALQPGSAWALIPFTFPLSNFRFLCSNRHGVTCRSSSRRFSGVLLALSGSLPFTDVNTGRAAEEWTANAHRTSIRAPMNLLGDRISSAPARGLHVTACWPISQS